MHTPTTRFPVATRTLIPICAMLICLSVVYSQISHVPLEDIRNAIQTIGLHQWLIAATGTAASFWAIGRYDVCWHGHLETKVPDRTARHSGMAAIAIGQAVGLGVLTGAIVRWHMIQPQCFKTATKVTLGVAISFLACWGLIALPAAIVVGFLPTDWRLALLLAATLMISLVIRNFKRIALLRKAPRLLALTTIDICFAGLALWALLPEAGLSMLPIVIAGYVLALGAGLISNAPGGLGAFEMVLILSLDQIAEPELIAAILGFRIVYYIGPAAIAGLALFSAHRKPKNLARRTTAAPISDLCYQGASCSPTGHVIRSHLCGTVVIEPQRDLPPASRVPLGFYALYKADARIAAQARKRGFTVRRIADDAIIELSAWSTAGASRRQLRRKLKQAQTAGVSVVVSHSDMPFADMAHVARLWQKTHGGELGYAMGRYDPAYVARQRVFLIYHADQLAGFVTVQTRPDAWAIDLIRHVPQMPTGAMHLAVQTIIAAAQHAQVKQLRLGAVPYDAGDSRLQNYAARQKAGLRQFKDSFGPHWSARYHIAPTRLQWFVSMLLIFLCIQRPISRLPDILRRSRGEFIKFTRIIHLNQRPARVTDDSNTARIKARAHDEPLLQTAG